MTLFIEIQDGALKGMRAPIREGLTFGRTGCDVNIQDPKVSSKHARIEARADGFFWLVDLGSSNGIRTEKLKLTELPLRPGIEFRLGQTHMVVQDAGALDLEFDPRLSLVQPTWFEGVQELAERGIKQPPQPPKEVLPFAQVVKLMITRGLQTGTEYYLGYGPRDVGGVSLDLPLYEEGLPQKCFQIKPDGRDAVLKVHADALGKVLLNGRFVETSSLKSGDMVDIGNTRIEVSFEG